MFIDKDSLIINELNMGSFITEVKYGYHKIWANDSGRNLAGVQSGTLIGIFPKITLQFGPLTKSEIETLAPILDSATQSLTYYDPVKKKSITLSTYTNDWELRNLNILQNEPFSIAFISRKKRG